MEIYDILVMEYIPKLEGVRNAIFRWNIWPWRVCPVCVLEFVIIFVSVAFVRV
jgi:hypothetical protein